MEEYKDMELTYDVFIETLRCKLKTTRPALLCRPICPMPKVTSIVC